MRKLHSQLMPVSVRTAAIPSAALAMALVAFGGEARAGGYGDGSFSWQAGGIVIVKPKYEGAKDYEVTGAPIVAPGGRSGGDGLVQFRGVDDLRFRVLRHEGLEAGPLVGYRFGRDEDDAARLRGLGDVDGGLVVGGYAGYRLHGIMPFVSYHHQVTGDDAGGLVRFGLDAQTHLRGVKTTAVAGATWADSDYMRSFFGVTAAQSATSQALLAPYAADAGIKDVFLSLSADVPIAERWSLKLMGRYAHLLGDAADSPIVESESQWSGGIGLSYRFGGARLD